MGKRSTRVTSVSGIRHFRWAVLKRMKERKVTFAKLARVTGMTPQGIAVFLKSEKESGNLETALKIGRYLRMNPKFTYTTSWEPKKHRGRANDE